MSALFPLCPCECWASVTWLQWSILSKQKLIYKSDTTIHLWHGQNRCIRLMQKPLISERPSQIQIGVRFNYFTCEVRFVLLSLWIAEEAELIGVYWMVEPVTDWPSLKVGGSTEYNSFHVTKLIKSLKLLHFRFTITKKETNFWETMWGHVEDLEHLIKIHSFQAIFQIYVCPLSPLLYLFNLCWLSFNNIQWGLQLYNIEKQRHYLHYCKELNLLCQFTKK